MPARSKEKSTKKQIVGEFRRRTLESDGVIGRVPDDRLDSRAGVIVQLD